MGVMAHLHQASALMQSQRCDDACDMVLTEKNEFGPKWVATSILEQLYLFPLISMRALSQASSQP